MPAIMDDPSSPTIHRVTGPAPYPIPGKPELPPNVLPRQVTLRDRQTIATVVPFASRDQVPASLLAYLSDQFAKEIEGGDTYPMIEPMPLEKFSAYWVQNFAGIMLLGRIESASDVVEGKDWSKECLGSFYIKPNYPGRSSHVCNGGFLVTDASRNRGVGRLMGESYLDWAPKLGYTYSVFNLVYETNVASCRIWDALGFKRIGRVKGCGNLKSYPDRLVDAIIYGRDLGDAGEGGGSGSGEPLLVSEERFDKIKFYLKYGRYPNGSDRAEKSRLRSAATHYKLLDNDVLMLKDKEVISDPVRQMDISRRLHEAGGHAGINKTTATIAEKYHWSRIKETVSDVIRMCDQCKESGKIPSVPNTASYRRPIVNSDRATAGSSVDPLSPEPSPVLGTGVCGNGAEGTGRVLELQAPAPAHNDLPPLLGPANPYEHHSDISSLLNPPPMQSSHDAGLLSHHHHHQHHPLLPSQLHHDSAATLASLHEAVDMYHPIDPQMISQAAHHHSVSHHHHHPHLFDPFHTNPRDTIPHHSSHSAHHSLSGHEPYSPHDPHIVSSLHAIHALSHDPSFDTPMHHHHHNHHRHDPDSFQALLHDESDLDPTSHHHNHHHHHFALSLTDPENYHHVHSNHNHHQHYRHRLDSHHEHQHHHHPVDLVVDPHDHHDASNSVVVDQDAMDRDLDMLIEHHDSSDSSGSGSLHVSPGPASPPSGIHMDIDEVIARGSDPDSDLHHHHHEHQHHDHGLDSDPHEHV
ncbi:hypothetical protein GGS23DRAFT_508948 [Durotheca rogersii]|uniref:uncharacterized protein n=1 Tax=Durotheca rogersii TaxID=419775 RepID=UPI00221EF15E|nr:uncharacterized protein GGS23DRAFT_508948 [Durotheca rogersii]KAI5863652.1 hypothetical protein GGS23DRAFT_508948 [Durotheca rogersii]